MPVSSVLVVASILLIGSLLVAAVRDEAANVIRWAVDALVQAFEVPTRAIGHLVLWLFKATENAYSALRAEHPGTHEGTLIFIPTVYALAAALLLWAEGSVTSLRIAALLGLDGVPVAHGLGLVTGAAWITTGTIWGMVLADLLHMTPPATPFHKATGTLRRILIVVAAIALGLVVVATAALFIAAQRQHDGQSPAILVTLFVALFGVLVALAAAVAITAALGAWHAIKAVLCMMLVIACLVVYTVLYIAISGLARLRLWLVALLDLAGKLGRLVWNWVCRFGWSERLGLRPLPAPRPSEPIGNLVHTSLFPTALVPELLAQRQAVTEQRVHREEIDVVPASSRNIVLIGIGRFGGTIVPRLQSGPVLASAVLQDPSRLRQRRSWRVGAGVRDLTPTPEEVDSAFELMGAEGARDALVHSLCDKIVQAAALGRVRDGHLLLIGDLHSVDQSIVSLLRDLKARGLSATAVVEEPGLGSDDFDMEVDPVARLTTLWQEEVVYSTFLVASDSPFAREHGPRSFEDHLVTALESLIRSPLDSEANLSLADISKRLSSTPFSSLRVASRPTVPGRTVGWWELMRPLVKGPVRGSCDLADAVTQTGRAIESVKSDGQTAFLLAPSLVRADAPIAVCTAPIRPRDPKFEEFRDQAARVALSEHSTFIGVFASGNGAGDPDPATPYRVQITLLSPLALPSPALAEPRSTEKASQNGSGSANPSASEAFVASIQEA